MKSLIAALVLSVILFRQLFTQIELHILLTKYMVSVRHSILSAYQSEHGSLPHEHFKKKIDFSVQPV